MSSLDLTGIDWLGHGWLLLLSFTVAVLLVAALRKPCRHLFGTERAFQLWLLPPLAMLVSQMPHAAAAGDGALPSLVYVITSVVSAPQTHVDSSLAVNWRAGVVLVWCVGMLVTLLIALLAQRRYRRQLAGAEVMSDCSSRWPVLRAISAEVGPALVGAWRSRIVLPADFESRYDATEQMLILAHEAAHARRRDGWWCLLAQFVAAIVWFHPLAWWALGALRHDQELACDAAVLREHGNRRFSYANAMLKTQAAGLALPIGCAWSPRHPITERIAMLKQSPSSHLQARLGLIAGFVLATIVTGAVYAASRPAIPVAATPSPAAAAGEYQLDIMVASFSKGAAADHAERTTGAICMKPGEPGGVNTDKGWQLGLKVMPLEGGRVSVALDLSAMPGKPPLSRRLEGRLGQPLLAEFNDADGKHAYSIDVTPLAGCPARVAESGATQRLTMIKQTVKDQPVRAVAESMARRAGLQITNPQDLSQRLVTLDFDQVPAERAMQLIADIDGMRAVFDDKRVRFEVK
ncbi:MAG: M56 family metallopeptidase [Rhodanobacter sp.]|jgi:beta-lactamase regulating signal transducer with metallopeptidase domain